MSQHYFYLGLNQYVLKFCERSVFQRQLQDRLLQPLVFLKYLIFLILLHVKEYSHYLLFLAHKVDDSCQENKALHFLTKAVQNHLKNRQLAQHHLVLKAKIGHYFGKLQPCEN